MTKLNILYSAPLNDYRGRLAGSEIKRENYTVFLSAEERTVVPFWTVYRWETDGVGRWCPSNGSGKFFDRRQAKKFARKLAQAETYEEIAVLHNENERRFRTIVNPMRIAQGMVALPLEPTENSRAWM